MPLPSPYFDPFDFTSELVTERVRAHAARLRPTEGRWLIKLIEQFSAERKQWNSKSELQPYRAEWARLRPRFLRLVFFRSFFVQKSGAKSIRHRYNLIR